MSENTEKLRSWIGECDNIVFFGGAGVSTESGIPDFRSADGLYHQQYRFPPEEIISHDFFERNPEEFFRFYRDKLIPPETVKPNAAHLRLAGLEREGKLRAVITQNIDGLHQAAGSKNVIELHGSVHRCRCAQCGVPVSPEIVNRGEGVPRCRCGGVLRPEVVLYGESLRDEDIDAAIRHIRSADMLIVGGTSLAVYPAAGLIRYFAGKHLVLINRSPTSYDSAADLILRENIGEVFSCV